MYFLANPRRFVQAYPYFLWPFVTLMVGGLGLGLVLGLGFAPADARHGEMVRLLYIHPQSAIVGLLCWAAMAVSAAIGFVLRHPLADMATQAIALPGLLFTALALATGFIWSVPGLGGLEFADPMIILVEILLLLYIAYFVLVHAFDDPLVGRRMASFLAMLGLVVVLLIHYTPDLFNTAHQERGAGPRAIRGALYYPFLAMLLGCIGVAGTLSLLRVRLLLDDMKLRTAQLRASAPSPKDLNV